MVNRTKGFHIDWSGHRAAQQLIAETGRIEGEGQAAIIGGILGGIGGAMDTMRANKAQAQASAAKQDDTNWRRSLEEARITGYIQTPAAGGGQPAAAPRRGAPT